MMAWDAALNVLAGDAQTWAMIMTPVRVKGVYGLKGLKVYFSKKGEFYLYFTKNKLTY